MIVYLLLPLVTFIPGLILCKERFGKWGRGIYCVIFAAAVFAVAALRYDVGTDYIAYKKSFESCLTNPNSLTSARMEKGYYVSQYFIARRFDDFRIYFAIIAFIFSAGAAVWIFQHSSKPYISGTAFVMFGMLFYSMNFLRQYMAALVVLYALDNVKKRDFVRYFVMVLFAACFHWSALIMIPFYFILQIKLQPILLTSIFAAAGVILVFSWNIIYLLQAFYEHFGMNSSYFHETSIEMAVGVYLYYPLGYTILFALMFIFRKRTYQANTDNIFYMACMLFVVLFEFWGAKHAIISRFALFFVMPAVLGLLPDSITAAAEFAEEHIKQKAAARVLSFTAFAACAIFFFGKMISLNGNGCQPYKIWWDYRKPAKVQVAEDEPEATTVTALPESPDDDSEEVGCLFDEDLLFDE